MFLNCLLPVDVVITADKRKLCVYVRQLIWRHQKPSRMTNTPTQILTYNNSSEGFCADRWMSLCFLNVFVCTAMQIIRFRSSSNKQAVTFWSSLNDLREEQWLEFKGRQTLRVVSLLHTRVCCSRFYQWNVPFVECTLENTGSLNPFCSYITGSFYMFGIVLSSWIYFL